MANLITTEESNDELTLTTSELNVTVPTKVEEDIEVENALVNGNLVTSGNATIAGNLTVGGNATWASSIVGTTKAFDIPHPTKEEMRLRYGCLEGPEYGVYVRGKTSEGIIPLPDYWEGLVDEKSITVHLTPTCFDQELVVQSIFGLKIQVGGNYRAPYYFMVMAERKDVPVLEVERNA